MWEWMNVKAGLILYTSENQANIWSFMEENIVLLHNVTYCFLSSADIEYHTLSYIFQILYFIFLKEVSYAQACIYLIQNIVKNFNK